MYPLIQIGPLAVPTAPMLLLISIWVGLSASEKNAEKFLISREQIYNLVFAGLIAGVAGARLTYAVRFPGVFLENPLALLTLRPVMFDPQGGLLIGLAVALVYQQNKKLPFWRTLDALTFGLSVFFVGLGMAHFASGDAFGAASQVPWGIWLWGEYRHPSQVYEILAALMVFGIVYKKSNFARNQREGYLFLTFTAYTSGLRLFLETFRGDSVLILGQIRSAQIIYWLMLAVSLWLLNRLLSSKQENEVV